MSNTIFQEGQKIPGDFSPAPPGYGPEYATYSNFSSAYSKIFLKLHAEFSKSFSSTKYDTKNQGRSQDFSKGGAEVMEAKAL